MELQTLRRLIGRCNPREPLEDDDERYVDVDHIDGEAHRPRRLAWVDEIARVYELAETPQRMLLSGLPGSGKSTELRRVATRLARPDGARLLPVLIDAEDVIDIDQPIDVPDLVLAILAEVEAAVLQLEGRGDRPVGYESRFERFWNFVTNTDLSFSELGAKGIVARLRSDPSLRSQVRSSVSGRTTEFLEQARKVLRDLEARVRPYEIGGRPGQPKYAGIFVIFDSLEKLRGFSSTFRDVLDSVEAVMGRGAEPLALGIHTLFTVPLAVARRIDGVRLMPLIKVCEPNADATPFEPGRRALRRVIEVRLADAVHDVFGPRADERIEQLITRSGGYARELIELLRLALHKDLPVSDADFRIILAERANEYERKVPREAIGMLQEIKQNKRPFVVQSEQPALEEQLLTRSLVMVYQNDNEWTDVNPAIARLLDQWQDS